MPSLATQERLTSATTALPRGEPAVTVSIIVPAHNAQRTLDMCLQALDTKQPNVELIVIDDASSDHTSRIAKRHEAAVVRLSHNLGAGAARNAGAKVARGDLLVFVDSDVIVPSDWMELTRAYFSRHPEVSAITVVLSKEHPNTDFFSQYKNLYMHGILARCEQSIDFLYGSLFAVRKADFLKLSEERILGEDTELGGRMAAAGMEIHLLKNLQVVHLKRYSFLALMRNDFLVPFYFGRILVRRFTWLSVIRKRHFSHASARQIAALSLSPVVLAAVLLAMSSWTGWIVLAVAAALIGVLNTDLLKLYASARGIRFAILSYLLTIVDSLVMWAGAVSGMATEYVTQVLELSRYA